MQQRHQGSPQNRPPACPLRPASPQQRHAKLLHRHGSVGIKAGLRGQRGQVFPAHRASWGGGGQVGARGEAQRPWPAVAGRRGTPFLPGIETQVPAGCTHDGTRPPALLRRAACKPSSQAQPKPQQHPRTSLELCGICRRHRRPLLVLRSVAVGCGAILWEGQPRAARVQRVEAPAPRRTSRGASALAARSSAFMAACPRLQTCTHTAGLLPRSGLPLLSSGPCPPLVVLPCRQTCGRSRLMSPYVTSCCATAVSCAAVSNLSMPSPCRGAHSGGVSWVGGGGVCVCWGGEECVCVVVVVCVGGGVGVGGWGGGGGEGLSGACTHHPTALACPMAAPPRTALDRSFSRASTAGRTCLHCTPPTRHAPRFCRRRRA